MRIRGRRRAGYAVVLVAVVSCFGKTAPNGTGSGGPSGAGGTGPTGGTAGTVAAGGHEPGGGGGSFAGGGGVDASSGCPWSECDYSHYWLFQCNDCFENDGDGFLDSEDPDCLGPWDYSEQVWGSALSGGNSCSQDCYFDPNQDSIDDQCFWSHKCDPLSVPPDYFPGGPNCEYEPDAAVWGTTASCTELMSTQSDTCLTRCGPLVPNGCDCFGCCVVPQAATPIWLGMDSDAPCSRATAADPTFCPPCTIVPSCFNPCETCELCLGKTSLPPECGSVQQCPAGAQQCGLPGQPCCPVDTYCITGCCQAENVWW
jgi:hypothetical protein